MSVSFCISLLMPKKQACQVYFFSRCGKSIWSPGLGIFVSQHGIWTLGDISGQNLMLDFPDLISNFRISRSSQFLYFRVKSTLISLKVPWGPELGTHCLRSLMERAPQKKKKSPIFITISCHTALSSQMQETPTSLKWWLQVQDCWGET